MRFFQVYSERFHKVEDVIIMTTVYNDISAGSNANANSTIAANNDLESI